MIIALAAIFAVLVAADQVSKVLAADMLKTVGSSAEFIPGFIRIIRFQAYAVVRRGAGGQQRRRYQNQNKQFFHRSSTKIALYSILIRKCILSSEYGKC